MAAFEETSDQSRPASPRGPVFVDDSGRRLRRLKLIGLGALGLVAGYVILLLVAFIGGSNVAAPYLPLPANPVARDLPSSPSGPASPADGQAKEAGSAEPAARAAVQAPVTAVQAPVSPAPAVPLALPANTAAMQPAAPVAPEATAAPSAEPTAPGMSGTAPGQTMRPSAPPHP
jgi:hypothetical protein